MVREIVKDAETLLQKSFQSDIKTDQTLYHDLLDTCNYYGKDNCLGLAAIQLGERKKAIAVWVGDRYEIFVNPLIAERSHQTYIAEEGCLSIEGTRSVKRNEWVVLFWITVNGKAMKRKFSGLVAEIIQHEVDHCNGILI